MVEYLGVLTQRANTDVDNNRGDRVVSPQTMGSIIAAAKEAGLISAEVALQLNGRVGQMSLAEAKEPTALRSRFGDQGRRLYIVAATLMLHWTAGRSFHGLDPIPFGGISSAKQFARAK